MSAKIIPGGLSSDDRGFVRFINDFNAAALGIKRFYQVENNEACDTRAWHGHLKESKWVYCVTGSAIVIAIKMGVEDLGVPSLDPACGAEKPGRFVLSSTNPQILYIPAGYANGFRTLESGTIMMFFSSSTLEDSKGDDYRFPLDATKIDPFRVEIR